jgi:uncharacterized protein HemX
MVLIIGIGIVVYWFVKRQQKKKLKKRFTNTIEKTNLLNTLEQKGLWQKGEVKAYSELTDIVRNYIEEAIDIPAMESTTSELITGLRAP